MHKKAGTSNMGSGFFVFKKWLLPYVLKLMQVATTQLVAF